MVTPRSKHPIAAFGLIAAALAMPLAANAGGWGHRGHHGYGGGYHGYHGGYRHGGGYYHRGGHWSGGRWIAGALVAGAVVGLVDAAVNPAPVYEERPVVYARPRTTVIYEDGPVVERRVVETRTVIYDDPYAARYVRDDGYDGD